MTIQNSTVENPIKPIEGEVDLFEYIALLVLYRYRLAVASVFAAGLVFGATYLMPVKYSSNVLVAYNNYDKPGGVALKEYRGSDTVSLLERDMVIDASSENEKERLLARFRSYSFGTHFIEQNPEVLRYMYPKKWDERNEKWEDDFEIDMRKAVALFNKEFSWISPDEKTGLISVGFNAGDPQVAADMANKLVEEFKKFQKSVVLSELVRRRDYLESRLNVTSNLEFQRSIYRMLETQMSAETLINVRENYPFEVIQPAIPPLAKSSPKRLLFSILTMIIVLFLGVSYVIGRELFRKMASQLSGYQVKKSKKIKSDVDNDSGWAE